MRILHISNHTTARCGVAEFGRQLSAAVRAAGHEVVDWDGSYPACYARGGGTAGYWPSDLDQFDVVHLNWQPNTLNHYQPETLPAGPRGALSVFLHDLPPWSTCAIAAHADVTSGLEPHDLVDVVIPPPCLAYTPRVTLAARPTIGRTGIGTAGADTLKTICARHGWDLSDSAEVWISNEAEIDRLARCWVNVVWYHEDRSRSSAASIVATARRPTVLSRCTRFEHLLRDWWQEFVQVSDEGLEPALVRLMDEVGRGQQIRVPTFAVEALQWPRLLPPLLAVWEARL